MTVEELQAKLDAMRESLKAFVEQANRQIAATEGAIGMLEQLIAEQTAGQPTPEEGTDELAADSD